MSNGKVCAVSCLLVCNLSNKTYQNFPYGSAVDDFRSYDFFPGTKYTASVTRLLRRPRTLILPVGPAGTGESDS